MIQKTTTKNRWSRRSRGNVITHTADNTKKQKVITNTGDNIVMIQKKKNNKNRWSKGPRGKIITHRGDNTTHRG